MENQYFLLRRFQYTSLALLKFYFIRPIKKNHVAHYVAHEDHSIALEDHYVAHEAHCVAHEAHYVGCSPRGSLCT